MRDRASLEGTFRFDEPGVLPRPGAIGRVVRFAFGILCLLLAWRLLFHGGVADLENPGYWVWVIFGLMLAPYVINIGFGVRWGAWPRWLSGGLLALGGAASFAIAGSLVAEPLWWVVSGWLVYLYGHLGLSFVLAAILATPGCEMRALPHLAGLLRRRDSREHYCPGLIDTVDRWERGELESEEAGLRDLVASPARMLLLYGVPFLLLQLAGNLGGPLIGNGVPALALLFVGMVCAVNALRCRRVHCVFVAPVFLTAGSLMVLYTASWVDFGPGTWGLVVNSALGAGFLVGLSSERIFGRYLGADDG